VSTKLTGRAAAPGAAAAPACTVETTVAPTESLPASHAGSAEEEKERLDAALGRAEAELRELAERVAASAGEEEAEIFEAHAEFTADPELASQSWAAIQLGASAERAITQAFESFRQLLASSQNEYLAARAADLNDVRDRVVAILLGKDTGVRVPTERSVIVARELTPSQTASIPRELIAAVVTETGSPTSHAAILARSLGIPAVVACHGLLEQAEDGVVVAVDGRLGEVTIAPDEDELREIEERMREEDKRRAELTALREEPGRTADERHIELAANIGSPEDLPVAIEAGAEGSGLVRTEFLFLGRRAAPSVDDQARYYTEVLQAFPGKRVVFRTMDIGADKPLPFVDQGQEENPALGVRGIRLSLTQRHLLEDQIRALLKAQEDAGETTGRLAIMFPMVSTAAEFARAREICAEVAQQDGTDLDDVEIGAMIEVPSAALSAGRVAARADFLSIGTNDLLQYLFAADRLSGLVSELADVCEPEVLSLIGGIIEAGHDNGAWVGVCGESANEPIVAAALVGLGADELSMTRIAIPEVKDTLRSLSFEDCREAVHTAIAEAGDGAEARGLLEKRLGLPR
jgi:phosphoenolpyruvate-protein phosphotransferase (PTS system enzyme I)